MTSPTGSPGVEGEAVQERGSEAVLAPGLHVALVRPQDLAGPREQRVGDRVQGGVLCRGVQRGQRARGRLRVPAALGDR
jgi:hypothetical protein